MPESPRRPHAALDRAGRRVKAEKILRILSRAGLPGRPLRVLEVGTGSGAIASYFAIDSGLACDVDAVDVLDQRVVFDGYRFTRVDGTGLPFEARSFDVVISNHVIEHVGPLESQRAHLTEIARVLREDGVAYLASPSRWQVVEPHFGILFLSWLPRGWRSPYLRWRIGMEYDCEPLRQPEIEALFHASGLRFRDECRAAVFEIRRERRAHPLLEVAARMPDWLFRSLRPMCPTHVYLLFREHGR